MKITDFGVLQTKEGKECPFVVTDFIDGLPLDEYVGQAGTTGADIIDVLSQVLRGLVYLHGKNVLHCDIKPKNIMIRSGALAQESPSAVIIDLGISHHVPPQDHDPADSRRDEYTYYFATADYVPDVLRPVFANRNRPQVSRRELRLQFPWLDLHAFGVVIGRLLAEPAVEATLAAHLGRVNMEALHDMRRRLDNPGDSSDYFRSALDVEQALKRLPFSKISPLGLAELAPVPEKGVILPTSRARVPCSTRVDAVISHPLFQRLHNLPQLDLLHYVLPGATHTRFVHALHTYDLARTAICHQLDDWRFRISVATKDVDCALFMALLDSVGRYHFQHMFEDFLHDRGQPNVRSAGLLADHELLNELMSTDGKDEYAELRGTRDSKGRNLGDVLTECAGLEWAEMRRRQANPTSPIQGFLAGLLSNPVDVDKLAYLIDDSAFSGLPFGQAVAPGPIFEALRVPAKTDWDGLLDTKVAVAVREKALSYVEQAVLSRYWNIQTGYWYRTNRSLQAMVKYQIGELLKARSLSFSEFILSTLHLSDDGALRWLDAKFRSARKAGAIPEETVNPMEGLLQSRRETR